MPDKCPPGIPAGPSQYDELDRAFGVTGPVNTTPQRPMTPAEQAANLIDQAAELADTTNLGRLEELTTALEVLYRDGVGYPFRDAIGELGQNLSTARMHMARARRMYAEELERLTAAVETWANDYRVTAANRDDLLERLKDERQRPGPQPGPGPSLRDLLTELSNRLAGTSHGERLDLPLYCRMALDSIPADLLDYRPGP